VFPPNFGRPPWAGRLFFPLNEGSKQALLFWGEKALEIVWDYKIYAYDACYFESAKRLNLPLLTFDGSMVRVGKELGINILGGKNAGF
jgi:hypothetical protein